MKAQVLLAGLVFAAVACSGPESGQVVSKRYEPAHDWWSLYCAAYQTNGGCAVQVPQQHHEPEQWVLVLRAGDDEGDRPVYRQAYEQCGAGDMYPACASG